MQFLPFDRQRNGEARRNGNDCKAQAIVCKWTSASRRSAPMEALLAAELPEGDGWQFEPKWDGFRCLARRDGDEVTLTSKSGKPLARYFPEVVEMLRGLKEKQFLLDGELIIPVGDALSFDALQLRLHPAESRVRKLSAQTPAELMVFDLLEVGGQDLDSRAAAEAARGLETFFARNPVAGLAPLAGDHRSRNRRSTGFSAAAERSMA